MSPVFQASGDGSGDDTLDDHETKDKLMKNMERKKETARVSKSGRCEHGV